MFLGFDLIDTLKSFSLSFFWVAIVAMGFSISNQRQPASIHEDSLNKPWRPIPSQRITPSQANTLFSVVTVMGLVYSGLFGGLGPYLIQLAATYMYNDLGGAQGHHVIRDFLNAVGMTSWVFGCIDVAAGPGFHFTSADLIPSAVLAAAITTTIAIQDFRDFDGDRECGRATLPIAIGQGYARVLIAVSILSWSFGVVILLGSGLVSALTGLGTLIAMRLLFLRTRSADKITMEFWYGWFATLPLVLL
ncbi:UbiA prenyltransferase family [Massariosphaeria phaeospora]|uniref:UbiA prenyltransferase family n=1 Tax=Massariosphaeria phaeospora TaxID=100035 RepID=A0A7C8I884_9PLEO|nr:UbiA prenyltransferase family [Massariosphaeria phaeospora]